nr:acyl-coa dehydrogenase apdg [Quercus suber]
MQTRSWCYSRTKYALMNKLGGDWRACVSPRPFRHAPHGPCHPYYTVDLGIDTTAETQSLQDDTENHASLASISLLSVPSITLIQFVHHNPIAPPSTPPTMKASLTRQEVAKHTTEEDLWVIVDHKVYDLSEFIDAHPGGSVVLTQVAGQDATQAFYNLHRHEVLQQYSSLCLGTVEGEKPEVIDPQPGDLSKVPYGEPCWLSPSYKSPYYKDSHRKLQKAMRVFVEEHVKPEAQEKEKDGTHISQELIDKMAKANVLAMRLGPGEHLHGRSLLGVMDGKDFDVFHDLIVSQELNRVNARGFQDGNMAGMTISLTAVQHWLNNKELKQKITDEVLAGKKKMSLAITEAFAGSDVAGLRTTAESSEDGQHYIINGTKKWITNGMFSDYFVTGCKTKKGFSVILVPRGEGVETKPIKTSYSAAAATTYIEFNNVKVPKSYLLGEEDKGFAVIMSNFNHERWMMVCATNRWTRTVLEECLKWTHQRLVFGKPLVAQPVIRQKLAKMIALVESNQAWLEQVTDQMNKLSYAEQSKLMAGPIGLLKFHATRSAHEIADDATNIFGGRGLTQSGMGKVVEMFHRTYKFDAILGGTEEILADLGVRQAMKFMPKAML